jgi:UDPglucose 6-dehydrogenase
MNIGVIGSGYVGLVAAACFAEMGNDVVCVDVDQLKIDKLKKGIIPIYEPGLSALVRDNFGKGSLRFSIDINDALSIAEVVFIAVGTPMGDDGSADLKYVLQVAQSIGENMKHDLVIVDKSTVPIGTADKVKETIQSALDSRD